ncbi:hypothetical protein QCA50_005813 [Cerrena zonata]|uniref:Uncharacterized protein n=1 Tax=Cerrena zonata TaxID=2478898 RepID=A0AAW0GM47_9APHY
MPYNRHIGGGLSFVQSHPVAAIHNMNPCDLCCPHCCCCCCCIPTREIPGERKYKVPLFRGGNIWGTERNHASWRSVEHPVATGLENDGSIEHARDEHISEPDQEAIANGHQSHIEEDVEGDVDQREEELGDGPDDSEAARALEEEQKKGRWKLQYIPPDE